MEETMDITLEFLVFVFSFEWGKEMKKWKN